MLRDQREQETNMFLRLRTNRTQQDRIRPVVDNGTKIVDLMKVIHQQNQKAELSRVSCAVEMRTSWERGGRRSEPRMTRQWSQEMQVLWAAQRGTQASRAQQLVWQGAVLRASQCCWWRGEMTPEDKGSYALQRQGCVSSSGMNTAWATEAVWAKRKRKRTRKSLCGRLLAQHERLGFDPQHHFFKKQGRVREKAAIPLPWAKSPTPCKWDKGGIQVNCPRDKEAKAWNMQNCLFLVLPYSIGQSSSAGWNPIETHERANRTAFPLAPH